MRPDSSGTMVVTIRHWLPILTFCPVNNMPDLIYAALSFTVSEGEQAPELYAVRKKVRKLLSGRKMFMEDCALVLAAEFPNATMITIQLAFNRHLVAHFQ